MPAVRIFVSIFGFSLTQTDATLAAAPQSARAGSALERMSASLRAGPHASQHEAKELASPATKARAKLEIHYETLCPYCTQLISESLKTIWKDEEFRERIDVALFPAGNMNAIPAAEVSEGYKFFHADLVEKDLGYVFQCQHGETECFGNMVQACIMKVESEPKDYLPILFCMEAGAGEGDSLEKVAFECMKEQDIDVDEVLHCTQTAEANEMMFQISNYSNSLDPQRQYVPWVTIDGQHAAEADEGDLLGPLCRALTAPLPAACKEASDRSHSGGIVGKIGHWFGGLQETGLTGPPRLNITSNFCYP